MKIVNAYIAAKEAFYPAIVEQKIEAVMDKLEEKQVSFVTKDDIAALEASKKKKRKSATPGNTNTPAMKKCWISFALRKPQQTNLDSMFGAIAQMQDVQAITLKSTMNGLALSDGYSVSTA